MDCRLTVREVTNHYGKCIVADNGTVEMLILISSGPRILSFGLVEGKNVFCDSDPFEVSFDSGTWRIVGGHRLWHSPEVIKRTYYPDNSPVYWKVCDNEIHLSDQLQPWVQVKKDICISFLPEKNCVRISHTLTNRNAWDIRLAAWSLSEMAAGSVGVLPLACYEPDPMCGSNNLRNLILWPYARLSDERVSFLDDYIILRQQKGNPAEFKLGTNNEKAWLAAFNNAGLFVKRFDFVKGAEYPDKGCNCEAYIDANMLELETLSPMTELKPDESVTHVERWELYDGIPPLPKDSAKALEHIKKYLG